jgi:hypothetical protein
MPKFGTGHEVTKEHRDMIRVLFSSEYCGDLNEWEETFLENIKTQSSLSDKQRATLHKVFDSVTSGERHEHDNYDYPDDGWGDK